MAAEPMQTQAAVERNIEAILALESEEQRALTRHQKTIERVFTTLSVPAVLYGTAFMIFAWIAVNVAMLGSGRAPVDRPPFGWLQTAVGILGLLLASLIVIVQARQGRRAERNAHLDLQINLLVDQKVSKIIQLIEELRVDSPSIRNRRDESVEELQFEVDPSRVASIIADKLESISGESAEPD